MRVLGQVAEESNWRLESSNAYAVSRCHPLQAVDLKPFDRRDGLLVERTAPQEGPQPGQQFIERERLDEIIVRPRVEPLHAVVDRIPGASGPGSAGRTLQLATGASNSTPLPSGSMISSTTTSGWRCKSLPRLADRTRRNDLVSLLFQTANEVSQEGPLVFDDENSSHTFMSGGFGTAKPATGSGRNAISGSRKRVATSFSVFTMAPKSSGGRIIRANSSLRERRLRVGAGAPTFQIPIRRPARMHNRAALNQERTAGRRLDQEHLRERAYDPASRLHERMSLCPRGGFLISSDKCFRKRLRGRYNDSREVSLRRGVCPTGKSLVLPTFPTV